MTVRTNPKERIGTMKKTKALAAMLVAAMMAAGAMGTASPAHAATTFTVNSTADSPDTFPNSNTCDTDVFTNGDQCTLRAAIQQANATAGADAINFAIAGTGVKTINVGASGFGALPAITDPVTVDGYTQPGSSPNTKAVGNDAVLKVELNGTSVPGAEGLTITAVNGPSVVKGLAINRFGEGITVSGDTVGNRVEGNFIGTDPTGALDRGNTDDGVNVLNGASENFIGGTTPAARNLISGNGCNAVTVKDATANLIGGNYVGTDKTGAKGLTNGDGSGCAAVAILDSSGNTVGGATAGARNLISGNAEDGVHISGGGNRVLGNRIGTTANGTGALGNGEDGVFVQGSDNLVGNGTAAGSNAIAFNGDDGVEVQVSLSAGKDRNAISRNSIFSNTGLGIDLHGGFEDAQGNTANDPGDVDEGPNGLQNKPVVSSAKSSSTKTTIAGKLASRPNSGFVVEFYSNPSGGEGKKFVGQKVVSTDGSGNATFTFSPATAVPAGQTITATARSANLDATFGDTSEFSAPRTVASS